MFDRITLSHVLKKHREAIACVDGKNIIRDCNANFTKWTGLRDQIPLEHLDSIIHPLDKDVWLNGLQRFLARNDETLRFILRVYPVHGNLRWYRVSLVSLSWPDNYFLVYLSDITEQKTIENKLIRDRNNAEKATEHKSEFLANTSHEIRTPIHTIISATHLLSETSMDQEQRDYLGQVQFASEVLLSLINDVLDFSKIEAGQLTLERTEFELRDLVEDALELVSLEAEKKSLDIGLYVDPDVPDRLFGDPTRLRQVIMNLVNNAVKFTHKGHVIVDVECLSVTGSTTRILFSVSDSGIGIHEDKQESLFQAFHQADSSTTREFGGTGLGLFISLNIIKHMGGDLSFSSKEGEGSTFFFELELDRVDKSLNEDQTRSGIYSGNRVLIVDDNPQVRDRLERSLQYWGFSVDKAGNAEDALELVHGTDKDPFDLLIIDQFMPVIDGWQLASEIHALNLDPPPHMILMSMKSGRGIAEAKMKLLGWFGAYVTKPVRMNTLAMAVSRLLKVNIEADDIASELEEYVHEQSPGLRIPMTGGRNCILIVEDHEVNRNLLNVMLEKLGYTVDVAVNGLEGYEKARQHNPDLIFMDCQMPVMNGYEATRKIRQEGLTVPIIALSAGVRIDDWKKCQEAGMSDFIGKPFRHFEITEKLQEYLGSSEPAGVFAQVEGHTEEHEHSGMVPAGEDELKEHPYAGSAVFDYDYAVETFMGMDDMVLRLSVSHIEKIEETMEQMTRALHEHDADALRNLSHSLKGGSLQIGMMQVGELCGDLEAAALAEEFGKARLLLDLLVQIVPALRDSVHSILAEKGGQQ